MSSHRILLIEGSIADISILRHSLDRIGERYELRVIPDGEEALSFIRQHRHGLIPPDPCVIVLDLHLPKVDGGRVLRAIHREPSLSHIRVIVTSSGTSPQQRQEVISLGAVYVTKPASVQGYTEFAEEVIAACKQTLQTNSG